MDLAIEEDIKGFKTFKVLARRIRRLITLILSYSLASLMFNYFAFNWLLSESSDWLVSLYTSEVNDEADSISLSLSEDCDECLSSLVTPDLFLSFLRLILSSFRFCLTNSLDSSIALSFCLLKNMPNRVALSKGTAGSAGLYVKDAFE